MIATEKIFSAENICTIAFLQNNLYFGSYIYNNGKRSGIIHIYKDDLFIKHIRTSGTFKLLSYNNRLIAINAFDISIYKNDIVETIYQTDEINTTGIIYNTILYFANIRGEIFSYSLNEYKLIKKERKSEEAIWSIYFFTTLLFGGDSNIFLYGGNTHSVDSTITSILYFNNQMYVLTYLSLYRLSNKIYKIENISGGWQLNTFKDNLVILNDVGMRIYSSDLILYDSYETKSNTYGYYNLDDQYIYLSSFYENKIFKLKLSKFN